MYKVHTRTSILSRFPKLTRPYYNVCPVPSRSLISVQTFCTKTALYGVAKKLNLLQNTVLRTLSDWDPLSLLPAQQTLGSV